MIFPCVFLERVYYFFKIVAVLNSLEFLYCNVVKKTKANGKFFQLLTCIYRFVFAALYLNISLFVILFLVDIVKSTFLVATLSGKLLLKDVAMTSPIYLLRYILLILEL